eukprot:Em0010g208a
MFKTVNAQYIVTIKSITNIAAGIMVILQVQTSNTVLSATVVTQVFTERKNTLAAGGFIIVSVAPYSEPASELSLEGTVAVIVVPTVVGSVIVAVVLVLLFMCCCQLDNGHSFPKKKIFPAGSESDKILDKRFIEA